MTYYRHKDTKRFPNVFIKSENVISNGAYFNGGKLDTAQSDFNERYIECSLSDLKDALNGLKAKWCKATVFAGVYQLMN